MSDGIVIRALTPADAKMFWQFRLEALETEPRAFGESPEEHRAGSVEAAASRLGSLPDYFVLGAFLDGALVGTLGFFRNDRVKTRHKGQVWGVYVAPSVRGKRVGGALMDAFRARARQIEGLEQVLLSVAADSPAARALYTSAGFEMYGFEPRGLRVGDEFVDHVHMILWLRNRKI